MNQRRGDQGRSLLMRSFLLCLGLLCCCPTSANQPTSIGVHIGPEYITAASFSVDDPPSPIAYVRGSSDYVSYLSDCRLHDGERFKWVDQWYVKDEKGDKVLAPPETHSLELAQEIFQQALREVKRAVEAALEAPVEIKSIARPTYFNVSTNKALADAFKETEESYRQYWQIIKPLDTAWLGYQLNTCEGIGQANGCEVEGDMLLIELNQDYLEIILAGFTDETHGIEQTTRLNNLTALESDNPGNDAQKPMLLSLKHQRSSIKHALRALTLQGDLHPDGKGWNFLTAIILAGEASPEAFRVLEEILEDIVPAPYTGLLRKDIDPFYLGAVGAAARGRWLALKPGSLDDIPDHNLLHYYDEPIRHEEL